MRKGIICGLVVLFIGSALAQAQVTTTQHKTNTTDLVEVVDQQQTSICNYGWNAYPPYLLEQGFEPNLTTLTKVHLLLFRAGEPSADIIISVSIRASQDGANLATATITGDAINSFPEWIEFNFTTLTVIPGHEYYILVSANGGDSNNCYCWCFGINNPYTRGDAWEGVAGYGWFLLDLPPDHPKTDFCFMTYGLTQPPAPPTITGATTGNEGQPYNCTMTSTDPDGTTVYYFIDWGDQTQSNWLGPYPSGQSITQQHTYDKRGNIKIQVKAKDAFGAESDWSTLHVKMPLSYTPPRPHLLERFFNRFPHAFPLLRRLLG